MSSSLINSSLVPKRSTITLPSGPVFLLSATSPCTKASITSSRATTSMKPSAVSSVVFQRTSRLRTLYRIGTTASLRHATRANTSDTLMRQAFQAGTSPPRRAVSAPTAGPHHSAAAGTKNTGNQPRGMRMPPATLLMRT